MKICSKCGVAKDDSEYHKCSSQCKLCKRKVYKATYKSKPLRVVARDIGHERILNNKRCAKHRDLNPKKALARVAVRKLKSPVRCMSCCLERKLEAHHDDYNKPTVVRWLCKACHVSWHINNKPIE